MSNKNIAAAHVLCRRLVSPFCQSVPSLPPYIFSSVKIPVACPCQILNGFSGTKLRQCLTSSCPQSWGKILLPIVWHSACRGWNKIPCFQKLAIHICSVYLQIKILYIYIYTYISAGPSPEACTSIHMRLGSVHRLVVIKCVLATYITYIYLLPLQACIKFLPSLHLRWETVNPC